MALGLTRRVIGLVFLMVCRGFSGIAGAKNVQAQQVYIKRTSFDYASRQLQKEYQYVSTATIRFSKQGYFYNRLMAAYQATPVIAKLPKAQRLLALTTLPEALHRGEQPELNTAVRKENDPDKALALNGL